MQHARHEGKVYPQGLKRLWNRDWKAVWFWRGKCGRPADFECKEALRSGKWREIEDMSIKFFMIEEIYQFSSMYDKEFLEKFSVCKEACWKGSS